jgi:predicted MPP superfamily phosphohydrolase
VLPADAGVLLTALVSVPLGALAVLGAVALRWRDRRARRLPRDSRAWYERRWIVRAALAVLAAYALVLAWGLGVEPRWVELTRTEIPIAGGALGRERLRIVHLSDFHLGRRLGLRELRMVELVREAKPELIVLTGDYMDTREASFALEEAVAALKAVDPPFGIWAVGGPVDEKFVTRDILRRAGIEWLGDETRLIEARGQRLRVAGREAWAMVSPADLFEGLDRETPTILLQHSSAGLEGLLSGPSAARVDLVFCGHTHGGQVRLPFRGALVRAPGGRDRGLHDVGGVPVYVNRGLGTTGVPIRLGARPEVALVELVRR